MTRRGVRISGGRFRGRKLSVPAGARPTSARLREALLDIWQSRVEDARVLDLFAGTGAVGLKALSRGAGFVVFIEEDRRAVDRLQRICGELAPDSTRVLRADLMAELDRVRQRVDTDYDLIFADPPYTFTEYESLLASVERLLAPGGEVVVEHSVRHELPEKVGGLVRTSVRDHGENRISFYAAD